MYRDLSLGEICGCHLITEAATSSRRLLPHHGGCYLITEAADIIFGEIHLHRRLIMSQVRFQEANVILLVQDPRSWCDRNLTRSCLKLLMKSSHCSVTSTRVVRLTGLPFKSSVTTFHWCSFTSTSSSSRSFSAASALVYELRNVDVQVDTPMALRGARRRAKFW